MIGWSSGMRSLASRLPSVHARKTVSMIIWEVEEEVVEVQEEEVEEVEEAEACRRSP